MQVLGDALELDPGQRGDFVHRACGADEALRAEVERLLKGKGNATVAIPTAHGAEQIANVLLPPSQIGPYRLIRALGEGGMGVVYLAMQEHPVRRTVALKLIRPGMDTREVVARFESERQALALMSHPNVAQVYDAGATDAGRPFFVMEYVDGQPITDWCDAQRGTTRQRLELMMQVCDAVQHAHQKGIVHRDLKPTNVLITMREAKPVPKVIDFGIAKAMEQRLNENSLVTELGQLVGTPEYMSPEQAGGEVDIDTRTHVYALGVLLYELLSGRLPFDRKMLRSSAHDEMRRIIRELDAPRPSSKLAKLDLNEARKIAEARGLDSHALQRNIRGDLDWIVMKSLEKDRERRYASPSELSADIQRHLNDEPVAAGPPTTRYRVRKFVRRYRAAVAATALVLAALLGGIVTTTWQAIRAVRAERATRIEQQRTIEQKTIAEKQTAVAEAQKAIAEKRFTDLRKLAGSFRFDVDETLQNAGPTKAREKLVNTAIEYLDALAKESADPKLAGELIEGYLRVGSVQFYPGTAHLGDPAGAKTSYRKAMQVAEALESADPDSIQPKMYRAGCFIYLAEAQDELNNFDAAFQSFETARQMYEQIGQRDPKQFTARRNVGLVYEKLSDLHRKLGRGKESLESRERSLKIYETVLSENPSKPMFIRDVELAHGGLSSLLQDMGKLTAALPHALKAQDSAEARLAQVPDSPHNRRDAHLALQHVAQLQWQLGHAGNAVEPSRRAVAICVRTLESDRSNQQARRDLAGAYAGLGQALLPAGNTREAVDSLRRSLEIRLEILQENPDDRKLVEWIARNHRDLAAALRQAGNLGEALAEAQAAAQFHEKRMQGEPQNFAAVTALIQSNCEIGQILLAQSATSDALGYLEKAVALRPPAPEELPESVANWRYMLPVLEALGRARASSGKSHEAQAAFDDVIRLSRALLVDSPDDDWVSALLSSALAQRGTTLLEQNRVDDAQSSIVEALEIALHVASKGSASVAAREALWQGQVAEAMLKGARGNPEGADQSLQAALDLARRLSADDPGNAHARGLVDRTVARISADEPNPRR